MYLRYIMTRNENDLLQRFFRAQCRKPSVNDWSETVKKDIEEFDLDLEFDDIKLYKKAKLSKIVKEASREKVFNDLLVIQEQYSKGSNLSYGKLKMRSYFKKKEISRQHASLIFKFRTRMIQVKNNFKNSNLKNMLCPVCLSGEEDTQEHLVSCTSLDKLVTVEQFRLLFGQNEKVMLDVITNMDTLLNQREAILEARRQAILETK